MLWSEVANISDLQTKHKTWKKPLISKAKRVHGILIALETSDQPVYLHFQGPAVPKTPSIPGYSLSARRKFASQLWEKLRQNEGRNTGFTAKQWVKFRFYQHWQDWVKAGFFFLSSSVQLRLRQVNPKQSIW